jgi:hypothetical protein
MRSLVHGGGGPGVGNAGTGLLASGLEGWPGGRRLRPGQKPAEIPPALPLARQLASERAANLTQRRQGAKPQPNCAKRLDCAELAPAFQPPPPYDSASKLDALRFAWQFIRPEKTSLAQQGEYSRHKCCAMGDPKYGIEPDA